MLYRIYIEREMRGDPNLELYIISDSLSLITDKVIERVSKEVSYAEIDMDYCVATINEYHPPKPHAIIHSHKNLEFLTKKK